MWCRIITEAIIFNSLDNHGDRGSKVVTRRINLWTRFGHTVLYSPDPVRAKCRNVIFFVPDSDATDYFSSVCTHTSSPVSDPVGKSDASLSLAHNALSRTCSRSEKLTRPETVLRKLYSRWLLSPSSRSAVPFAVRTHLPDAKCLVRNPNLRIPSSRIAFSPRNSYGNFHARFVSSPRLSQNRIRAAGASNEYVVQLIYATCNTARQTERTRDDAVIPVDAVVKVKS